MYERLAGRGLRILAFPCNQFGHQEPGSPEEIKATAAQFGVKFDLFSKIEVNGDGAHPLWKWMKNQPKGRGTLGNAIKWNFSKFLINREGQVVKRYSPMDDPYSAPSALMMAYFQANNVGEAGLKLGMPLQEDSPTGQVAAVE
ncbi:hypothetical protein lerEdw1_005686 [Lerista edwardsae]|nr:hypothetical protein lerEdw1_005686 [Lerista edwardsae]